MFFAQHYEMLSLLVLASSFSINLLLFEYKRSHSLTIFFLLICIFFKGILLPIQYCLAPIYSFSSFTPKNFDTINYGILLISYEVLLVTITALYYSQKKRKGVVYDCENNRSMYSTNASFLILFSCIIFILAFFYRGHLSSIHFFSLKANTEVRTSLETREISSFFNLLILLFIVSMYSMYIVFVSYLAKKYYENNKLFYYVCSLLLTVFMNSIILSEARSSQIYSGFASFYLLYRLFPNKGKQTILFIVSPIIVITVLLTLYKTLYVFNFESYEQAILESSFVNEDISKNFESYFLGPLHYAATLELYSTYDLFTLERLLFGIFRSTMGFNLFLKGYNYDTTNMVFCKFISNNLLDTGYLLPISCYCLLYLSPLLSPLLACFIYRISLSFEDTLHNSKSPFIVFFFSIIYIRLATCLIFTNINTILTLSSSYLIVFGTLFWLNHIITNNHKKEYIIFANTFSSKN